MLELLRNAAVRWGSRAWQAAGPLQPILFRPARAFYRTVAGRRTVVVWANGAWIALDPGDPVARWILSGGMEPLERAALASVLRSGDVFVDGGAHCGLYTVLGARGVGTSGRVLAFEPEPENRTRLERTVAANRLRNVVVSGCALSDGAGSSVLIRDATNSGGHSLVPETVGRAGGSVPVSTVALDQILGRLEAPWDEAPVAIKLDVQGLESRVLDGARRTLARTLVLLVEFTPAFLVRAGEDPEELPRRLLASGFTLRAFSVDDAPPRDVAAADVAPLVRRLLNDGFHVNLFATRGGR